MVFVHEIEVLRGNVIDGTFVYCRVRRFSREERRGDGIERGQPSHAYKFSCSYGG